MLVDTMTSELRVTDPDRIVTYNRIVDTLWAVALEGDDARRELARIAAALG